MMWLICHIVRTVAHEWTVKQMDKLQFVYTSDCVPVIRCASCKHCFDIGSDPMEPYDGESEWYCARFDGNTSAYEIDPYRFFCACGERRDDDAGD
jgi:hypothetical protein